MGIYTKSYKTQEEIKPIIKKGIKPIIKEEIKEKIID